MPSSIPPLLAPFFTELRKVVDVDQVYINNNFKRPTIRIIGKEDLSSRFLSDIFYKNFPRNNHMYSVPSLGNGLQERFLIAQSHTVIAELLICSNAKGAVKSEEEEAINFLEIKTVQSLYQNIDAKGHKVIQISDWAPIFKMKSGEIEKLIDEVNEHSRIDLPILLQLALENKNHRIHQIFLSRLAGWVKEDPSCVYRELWLTVFRSSQFSSISLPLVSQLLEAAEIDRYSKVAFGFACCRIWTRHDAANLDEEKLQILIRNFNTNELLDESLRIMVAKKIAERINKSTPSVVFDLISEEKLFARLTSVEKNRLEKWFDFFKEKRKKEALKKIQEYTKSLPLKVLKNQIDLAQIEGYFKGLDVISNIESFKGLIEPLLKMFPRTKTVNEKKEFFSKIVSCVFPQAKKTSSLFSYLELVVEIGNLFIKDSSGCLNDLLDPYCPNISAEEIENGDEKGLFKKNPSEFALKLLHPLWDRVIADRDVESFWLLIEQLSPKNSVAIQSTIDFVASKKLALTPFLVSLSSNIPTKGDEFEKMDRILSFAWEFSSSLLERQDELFQKFQKNVLNIIDHENRFVFSDKEINFIAKQKLTKLHVAWVFAWLASEDDGYLTFEERLLRDRIAIDLFERFCYDIWNTSKLPNLELLLPRFVERLPHLFVERGPEACFTKFTFEFFQNSPQSVILNLALPIIHSLLESMHDSIDLWERREIIERTLLPILFRMAVIARANALVHGDVFQSTPGGVHPLVGFDRAFSIFLRDCLQKWPDFKVDSSFLAPDQNLLLSFGLYLDALDKISQGFSYEAINGFICSLVPSNSSSDTVVYFDPEKMYNLSNEIEFSSMFFTKSLAEHIKISKNVFGRLLEKAKFNLNKLRNEGFQSSRFHKLHSSILYATAKQLTLALDKIVINTPIELKNIQGNLPLLLGEIAELDVRTQSGIYLKSALQNGEKVLRPIFAEIKIQLKAIEEENKCTGTLWTDQVETQYQQICEGDIYHLEQLLNSQPDDLLLAKSLYVIKQSYESSPIEEHGQIVARIQGDLVSRLKRVLRAENRDPQICFNMLDFISFFTKFIKPDDYFISLVFDFMKKERVSFFKTNEVKGANWFIAWFPSDSKVPDEIARFRREWIDDVFSKMMVKYWQSNAITPVVTVADQQALEQLISTYPDIYPENGVAKNLVNLLQCQASILIDPTKSQRLEKDFYVDQVLQYIGRISEIIEGDEELDLRLLNKASVSVLWRILNYYHHSVVNSRDERLLTVATSLFKGCLEKGLISDPGDFFVEGADLNNQFGMLKFGRLISKRLIDNKEVSPKQIMAFITNTPIVSTLMQMNADSHPYKDTHNPEICLLLLQIHFSCFDLERETFFKVLELFGSKENIISDYVNSSESIGDFEKGVFRSLIAKFNPWEKEGFIVESVDNFEENYFQATKYLLSLLGKINPAIRSQFLLDRDKNVFFLEIARVKDKLSPNLYARIDHEFGLFKQK